MRLLRGVRKTPATRHNLRSEKRKYNRKGRGSSAVHGPTNLLADRRRPARGSPPLLRRATECPGGRARRKDLNHRDAEAQRIPGKRVNPKILLCASGSLWFKSSCFRVVAAGPRWGSNLLWKVELMIASQKPTHLLRDAVGETRASQFGGQNAPSVSLHFEMTHLRMLPARGETRLDVVA